MDSITLYTGEEGYILFSKGKPFIASTEKRQGDFRVFAPISNIVEFHLEDDLDTYDVVKMNGVIVDKD